MKVRVERFSQSIFAHYIKRLVKHHLHNNRQLARELNQNKKQLDNNIAALALTSFKTNARQLNVLVVAKRVFSESTHTHERTRYNNNMT